MTKKLEKLKEVNAIINQQLIRLETKLFIENAQTVIIKEIREAKSVADSK